MAGKLLRAVCTLASAAIIVSAPSASAADSVIYGVDFSGFSGGSVLDWLGSKEFLPKQDAANGRRVVYSVSHDQLVLETRSRAFALLLNETDIRDYSRIRIEWRVDAFPPARRMKREFEAKPSWSTCSSARSVMRADRS